MKINSLSKIIKTIDLDFIDKYYKYYKKFVYIPLYENKKYKG